MHQDTWAGCYKESWNGLMVPDAYAHPAKFARGLIQRMYQHALQEGWLRPGETVLDPFGGVALGGLDAALLGVQWVGCELEAKFVTLAQANVEYWQRRYGHRPQWVRPIVLHGDSRQLAPILQGACVEACVASPPFQDQRHFHDPAFVKEDRRPGREHTQWQIYTVGEKHSGQSYGTHPGQLGTLPSGTLDACLSSPPYAEGCAHTGGPDLHPERIEGGKRGLGLGYSVVVSSPPFQQSDNRGNRANLDVLQAAVVRDGNGHAGKLGPSIGQSYGQTPGQLGTLPAGSVDAAIASPPFANTDTKPHGLGTGRGRADTDSAGRNKGDYHYPDSPGQLGQLPPGQVAAVVSSPPYEASVTTGHAPNKDIDRALSAGHTLQSMRNPGGQLRYKFEYGTSPDQLGNTQGTTFWEASRQILEQVYAVLKPGGVAIWVTKNYVRDGQEVPFTDDWARLCQAVGFAWLHHHQALLVEEHGMQGGLFGEDTVHRTARKSFFRRLAEKKGSPRIDYESVLCFRKPLAAAPMPQDEAWQQMPLCVNI